MGKAKHNSQQGSDKTYFPDGMGAGKQPVKVSGKKCIAGYFYTCVEHGAEKYR